MVNVESVTVSFNRADLPAHARFDIQARERLLEDGIAAVRARIPDLKIGTRIPMACTVQIEGTRTAIQRLVAFLQESKLASCEPTAARFKAADVPDRRKAHAGTG